MLAAVKACGPGAFLSHVPGAMVVEILEEAVEVTPEVTVPAGRLSGRPLRSAARRAQVKDLVTVREIVALLSRIGPVKGSRRLADVVATAPAPTRSAREDVVLDLLLDAGFEHLT